MSQYVLCCEAALSRGVRELAPDHATGTAALAVSDSAVTAVRYSWHSGCLLVCTHRGSATPVHVHPCFPQSPLSPLPQACLGSRGTEDHRPPGRQLHACTLHRVCSSSSTGPSVYVQCICGRVTAECAWPLARHTAREFLLQASGFVTLHPQTVCTLSLPPLLLRPNHWHWQQGGARNAPTPPSQTSQPEAGCCPQAVACSDSSAHAKGQDGPLCLTGDAAHMAQFQETEVWTVWYSQPIAGYMAGKERRCKDSRRQEAQALGYTCWQSMVPLKYLGDVYEGWGWGNRKDHQDSGSWHDDEG
jgi:hypothetical protein